VSDVELAVLFAVLAPIAVVAGLAMVRGYHLTVKLFRPEDRKDEGDGLR
jgi:hypothetical protein